LGQTIFDVALEFCDDLADWFCVAFLLYHTALLSPLRCFPTHDRRNNRYRSTFPDARDHPGGAHLLPWQGNSGQELRPDILSPRTGKGYQLLLERDF